MRQSPATMIGVSLGNYRITRQLGGGGMGTVYLAEHPTIGRKAAVKVLHPALAENEETVSRFFNEARTATAIRHPGIVEVLDFGALPSGASYLVMEFLEGDSLGTRLKRKGQLPIAEAVDIADQATHALEAAHAKGIVHRDLKPDNLFLVPDPRRPGRELLKVLDFGIAKLMGDTHEAGSVRTRTGTIMGTPLYMSPEQCRGTRDVDQRSDIYSLGIILYEMLCGRPPFTSLGHGELIHMHIATLPPSPTNHRAGIPRTLEQLLMRTLAKDPDERFQTMGELRQAMRQLPVEASTFTLSADTRYAGPEESSFNLMTTFGAAAQMARTRRAARVRKGFLLGGAAVAAAVVALSLRGGVLPLFAPTQEGPAPAAPTTAEHMAAPVEPPPAARPEPARTITVAIRSDPPGARVVRQRDGATIGVTPFREAWPAGTGVEELRVELYRHQPEVLSVPHDRDVDIALPLAKLPPAVRKPKGAASRRPPAPPAAVSAPAPARRPPPPKHEPTPF